MGKRKVILVTDGDSAAKEAVERAASNIGGRCISTSAGNPTKLSGYALAELIKQADHDPVVVMVDDRGKMGMGRGEAAMSFIMQDSDIDVLGVVAVSSNGRDCSGLRVSCSVTGSGHVVEGAVDKFGNIKRKNEICGDTLSILEGRRDVIIVGMGDPGKMDYKDGVTHGAPITTRALQEVIIRSSLKRPKITPADG